MDVLFSGKSASLSFLLTFSFGVIVGYKLKSWRIDYLERKSEDQLFREYLYELALQHRVEIHGLRSNKIYHDLPGMNETNLPRNISSSLFQ